ncbi:MULTISPECIES: zonular occludens toxin domain-containing protein [Burkholderia cepacia complex]|uniref:zonular occludens toxin domain-containing protein n=1 Tax=Burkholderia cepacia complex TaxID=87882 RepID=UPI00158AD1C8|nr:MULTISPECIES: zonular occludens toxin domain-containing protein [Burkholderia cepacia complex]MCA8094472.1 zonular occludens toxin domain-containing protein [Burkholderia anthina]MDN7616611.1 zonular occludens toxin domain-containing protein [Burkholderia cepacia]
MITLITGVPGSGKTLYAVSQLLKEEKAGRRIVVEGIRDLAITHETVDLDWMRSWHKNCRAGDVLVIDEVQRIWPHVSVSVKAGEDIEQLHVHRHMGVDWVIITQHPNRINKAVRDLVGRHVHVRRLFGLRKAMLYEWDSTHNPSSGFREAVKTVWSYPRQVFSLYTSAEMHTKPKAVVPKGLFLVPLGVLAAVVLGYLGYRKVMGLGAPSSSPSTSTAMAGSSSSARGSESRTWRVSGRYSVDGVWYVLLVGEDGRVRPVRNDFFKGDVGHVVGEVDGEAVSSWSGVSGVTSGVGGRK